VKRGTADYSALPWFSLQQRPSDRMRPYRPFCQRQARSLRLLLCCLARIQILLTCRLAALSSISRCPDHIVRMTGSRTPTTKQSKDRASDGPASRRACGALCTVVDDDLLNLERGSNYPKTLKACLKSKYDPKTSSGRRENEWKEMVDGGTTLFALAALARMSTSRNNILSTVL
jgi:hypothetical protein